jgi:hypothetical protein
VNLGLKFGGNRSNRFGVIALLVFFKMAAGGHLRFQNSNFSPDFPIAGPQRMIPAKFGPFRTSLFRAIAIFVNFNRRPAAILDFAKFHF